MCIYVYVHIYIYTRIHAYIHIVFNQDVGSWNASFCLFIGDTGLIEFNIHLHIALGTNPQGTAFMFWITWQLPHMQQCMWVVIYDQVQRVQHLYYAPHIYLTYIPHVYTSYATMYVGSKCCTRCKCCARCKCCTRSNCCTWSRAWLDRTDIYILSLLALCLFLSCALMYARVCMIRDGVCLVCVAPALAAHFKLCKSAEWAGTSSGRATHGSGMRLFFWWDVEWVGGKVCGNGSLCL